MKYCLIALLVSAFLLSFVLPQNSNEQQKVALGRQLFHDPILSRDRTISCASCHKPEFAFADTSAFSKGVGGKLSTRNTPSVMNMFNRESFFWDGRAKTLAEQALMPIEHPDEMNLPIDVAVKRLNKNTFYRNKFKEIFGEVPNAKNLGIAIAAFENSLESGGAPNDLWLDDVEDAMTAQQIRGREIFREKARCFDCHFTPDFTDDEFKNIGLFDGVKNNDSGRYLITRNISDIGKFKTPGLRNIAVTAPYMHDGRFKTLREVIDFYDDPRKLVPGALFIDTSLEKPLGLTEQEKQDLESFLHALTDPKFSQKK